MAQKFDPRSDSLGLLEIPGVVLRTSGTNMARGVTWAAELMDMVWESKPTINKALGAGVDKIDASIESFLKDNGVGPEVDRFDVKAVSETMRKHDKAEKAKRKSRTLSREEDEFFKLFSPLTEEQKKRLKAIEDQWSKATEAQRKDKNFIVKYEAAQKAVYDDKK